MKVLTFTVVAAIATTIIGFRHFAINPTYKATRVTSTVTQGADTNNAPHQEQDLKQHQEIHMPTNHAPALVLNDDHQQQYHITTNRELDSSCRDSPLKVLTGEARKSAKTCKFIAKKQKRFCKGRIIKSHCPDACGVCESFGTADSEGTFLFDGAKTDCAWLHDFVTPSTLLQISMLCKDNAIRETCRYTCGFFFHSCAMCSSEPTPRPSLEPSSIHHTQAPSESVTSHPSITLPTLSPSTLTLPSFTPSKFTSSTPSTIPSSSPPTTCLGKIISIIDKKFGDVAKGPPQEEAFDWLIEDIADDECDDEAMIIQRYILAVFYFSAGGDDWDYYEGWLESISECDWEGLVCNNNQQVISLYLNDELHGTIPAELASLTNLKEITLDQNKLSGSIPGNIFRLPKLEHLWLFSNNLTGSIPDNFGGSTSLKYIGLWDNLLTGTIPDVTGDSLQSIEDLSLALNKMSGPVPDSICDLRSRNPNQFQLLDVDCAPPENPQNPCLSGCCTKCSVGKGLP